MEILWDLVGLRSFGCVALFLWWFPAVSKLSKSLYAEKLTSVSKSEIGYEFRANYLNRHANTLLASALILAFNSAQAIVLTPPKNIGDWQGPGEWYTNENDDEINQFRLKDGQSATFDGVNAEITPLITNSEYFVSVGRGSSLTIIGTTKVSSESTKFNKDSYEQGTYTYHADNGNIYLKGNVEVLVTHNPAVSTETNGA